MPVFGVIGYWMLTNNLADVYAQDLMAGVFYSIYGINDWVFFAFFVFVFVQTCKVKK
jgi:hypothetical protein